MAENKNTIGGSVSYTGIGLHSGEISTITFKPAGKDEGIVFIRSNDSFEQLTELISGLQLGLNHIRPFTRCSICNSELARIPRDAAFGSVPDFVFETAVSFRQCLECRKIYWPGSHKGRMLEKLHSLFGWRPDELEEENGGR